MSLEVIPFYEPESCTWTYLLADALAGKAAVVDPVWGYDPASGRTDREFVDQVLAEAAVKGWDIEWVLETHAHADHLSAASLIKAETGARIAIGRGITSVQEAIRRAFHLEGLACDGSQFDRLMSEGDEIHLGELTLWVMETPGHTKDSITWLVRDVAFIGDTLFAPGYGSARCDFPGGNAGGLYDSIQRIHGLPGETRLFLCHDYPDKGAKPRSMVSAEESRSQNTHIGQDTRRDAFVAMREARDKTLSPPRLILPALQVNVLGGKAPPVEANGFSYLKMPFNVSIPELLRKS